MRARRLPSTSRVAARLAQAAVAGFVASLVSPPSARADYVEPVVESPSPTHRPANDAHTFLELRLGMVGLTSSARDPASRTLRYGPAIEASIGAAWTWLDLSMVGRLGSVPDREKRSTYAAFGPEIAARKYLGEATTLRVGVVPLYTVAWEVDGSSSRMGVDGLLQLLVTLDDSSRPVWRGGVGLRAGRYWSRGDREPVWSVGLDLLVRSWW